MEGISPNCVFRVLEGQNGVLERSGGPELQNRPPREQKQQFQAADEIAWKEA